MLYIISLIIQWNYNRKFYITFFLIIHFAKVNIYYYVNLEYILWILYTFLQNLIRKGFYSL